MLLLPIHKDSEVDWSDVDVDVDVGVDLCGGGSVGKGCSVGSTGNPIRGGPEVDDP